MSALNQRLRLKTARIIGSCALGIPSAYTFNLMLKRTALMRYSVAVIAPLASVLAGYVLQRTVGYRFPLITFYPTVMLAAWFGGIGPGLTATVLSIALVDQIWLSPLRASGLSNTGDPVALLLFFGVGVAISGFSESLHRSAAREASARRDAEHREAALRDSERRLRDALAGEQVARRDAEDANRQKDQFLAMVSHELRTPLNALLGWADMLKRDVLPEHRRGRAIEAIYANATREAQLVDDLLDLARLMSGKLPLHRTPVDLSEVIRAAIDVVQSSADAKQVELTVDLPSAIRPMRADATRLQQVVWNLLSNAIKFTRSHGVVSVRVADVGGCTEVTITDTGQGIPTDLLESIFQPFRQADTSPTREHGGLGLGLPIVRYVVEAHGGTVVARSAGEGHGATFVVRLPIETVASLDAAPSFDAAVAEQPSIDVAAALIASNQTVTT